ncbi:MAG: TetR family transcriptional regulator [Coriobacteriia bacterium]
MSLYTKEALALTLKRLIAEKDVDDITVRELVDACRMNRKTFYYHFHGLSDLIGWILVREFETACGDNCHPGTWQMGIAGKMRYMQENERLLNAIHHSRYRVEARECLRIQLEKDFASFAEEARLLHRREDGLNLAMSGVQGYYVVKYRSMMLFSMLEGWFVGGMKESVDEFIEIIETVLDFGAESSC